MQYRPAWCIISGVVLCKGEAAETMAAVYLDNSATTRVCRAAADKAYEMMTETYGNPSSLHTLGFRAEREIRAGA